MRRHDWNTSPNPFRIRPGDSGGHCTATGLDWTLQFKNFSIFSAAFQPFVQYWWWWWCWWSGWRAFWYPAVTPSYLTLLAGAHFTIVNWKFPSSFCCDSWKLASISVIIRKKLAIKPRDTESKDSIIFDPPRLAAGYYQAEYCQEQIGKIRKSSVVTSH